MNTAEVTPECKNLIKLAAKKLKGHERRAFVAEVAESICYGSPRLTETEFGFGRHTVELGMHEKRTGLICYGNYASSGKQKTEDISPQLIQDIRSLVEPESQADPQLRNTFAYTRVTAKNVRQKLVEEKNWDEGLLPQVRTFNNILNRLGYRLRKVEKTKPEKKIPETDAIFANVHRIREEASQRGRTLQISIDCKATVTLGDFSRGGKDRGTAAVKALDHDMAKKDKMIPFGILNLENDQLHVFYGNSYKTSDFICDALDQWWERVKESYRHIDELVIYADNGPENNSHRTQFLFRIVKFAQETGLKIHLVYYPPYHSKYNPIERSWAFLEDHWGGTLLNTVTAVLEWTKSMTWRCVNPMVSLLDKVYEKGVKLSKSGLAKIQPYILRNPELKKWDVTIVPDLVNS